MSTLKLPLSALSLLSSGSSEWWLTGDLFLLLLLLFCLESSGYFPMIDSNQQPCAVSQINQTHVGNRRGRGKSSEEIKCTWGQDGGICGDSTSQSESIWFNKLTYGLQACAGTHHDFILSLLFIILSFKCTFYFTKIGFHWLKTSHFCFLMCFQFVTICKGKEFQAFKN